MRQNMSRGDKNNHDGSFTDCLKKVTCVPKEAELLMCCGHHASIRPDLAFCNPTAGQKSFAIQLMILI